MPTFTPPTVDEAPAGEGPLFYRYKLTRGISVLKVGAAYREVRYPSQEEIEAADITYMGGHAHTVDATEAAALTAAGYGAYIT